MWPRACAEHENFHALSPYAKALLLDLLGQYRGNNNGDLACNFERMRKQGWKARNTVEKARAELEQRGWIVRTRQGWRHQCSLYALTFFAIDDCNGKLDETPTTQGLGFWKEGKNPWLERQKPKRPPPPEIKSVAHAVSNVTHRVTKKHPDLTHLVRNLTHEVS